VTTAESSEASRAEAERQLAAAVERHREAVSSMQERGRSEAGRNVAVKSVGRAIHLVSFTLRRAADADVPFERLVELTGWEPDLVREGLERLPEPRVVARLAPAGVDPYAVAQAAAAFDSLTRLRELTGRILADVDLDPAADAPAPLAFEDLEALREGLEAAWRSWRQGLLSDT
jgi:hypothetical protein